jgi:hypothetical protein
MRFVLSSRASGILAGLSILVAMALGAACGTGAPAAPDSPQTKPGTTGGTPTPPYVVPLAPFSPDSPYTYVAKVKNILIGQPPTDAEIKQVIAEPSSLGTLIQGWTQIKDPNNTDGLTYYQEKMLVFFKLAFEQTQIAAVDFVDLFDQGQFEPFSSPNGLVLLQSVQESFARTMLNLTAANQPFTQAMTTQTFALTTALKTFYALMDAYQTNDTIDGEVDSFATANPTLEIYVTGKTNIPLSETLDKTNSNYMHWYVPGLKCTTDPVKFAARSNLLYDVLMGVFPATTFPGCTSTGATPPLQPSYYSDWTMVTISQPTTGEATTPFYDLADLPTATTMVLNRPFVGFFTTPAFFANWQTNASNQMRVTTNQALIVALGAMILPTPSIPTVVKETPGLDTTHATGVCVGCHQYLDPTRSLFAQQMSWNYGFGLQNATIDGDDFAKQPGMFIFEGMVQSPTTLAGFGNVLATHPLFAQAWVQKLSYYVNSQANDPSDPIFKTIVSNFTTSSSWSQLVLDLMTSPLTTNTVRTETTTDEGVIVAVARRDHLCAALNFRLGFTDICALNAATKVPYGPLQTISLIAGGLPSDGYGRGSTVPVLPNQPSLFYRAGTENICEAVAQLVIDVPAKDQITGVKQWSSTPASSATAAITEFVTLIAGITESNPLYNPILAKLNAHYASAMAVTGTTTTEALESTFTAACLSPSFVGIGM